MSLKKDKLNLYESHSLKIVFRAVGADSPSLNNIS